VKPDDLKAAHKHSNRHRAELESSDQCGCFHCLEVFSTKQIDVWVDDEDTALCPICGIDAVIGSTAGFPLTAAFLSEMRQHWFS